MRYVLIDRFLELERGKRARAVKCVTRNEGAMEGREVFPPALVLEAILQTGGILTRASAGDDRSTVLGKVEWAKFPDLARAGDRIEIAVDVVLFRPEGTLCEGRAFVGERELGRARFLILFLPEERQERIGPTHLEKRRRLMKALKVPVFPKAPSRSAQEPK